MSDLQPVCPRCASRDIAVNYMDEVGTCVGWISGEDPNEYTAPARCRSCGTSLVHRRKGTSITITDPATGNGYAISAPRPVVSLVDELGKSFVLEPRHAAAQPIGFVCYQEAGAEVTRYRDGAQVPGDLTDKTELHVGDELVCPTLLGNVLATVDDLGDGKGTARTASGKTLVFLEYNQRHHGGSAWVSTGSANLAALQRLELK